MLPNIDKEEIRKKAEDFGFCAAGFAATKALPEWEERLSQHLAEGRHASMRWLARDPHKRANPEVLWSEAKTVVSLISSYAEWADDTPCPLDLGQVATYAKGTDYHETMRRNLLHFGEWLRENYGGEIKVFVDSSPIMEKPLAQQAGLGWQGRHTALVSPKFGGFILLGELFTTLEITPDNPEVNHCGSCCACIQACPTGAISGDYRLDANKCLAFHTIENRENIPDELLDKLGNRVYGCDSCIAACPFNQKAVKPQSPLVAKKSLNRLSLKDWLSLNAKDFATLVEGTPLERTGRARVMRNVLIAAGNSKDSSLLPLIELRLSDVAPEVVFAAQWAKQKLSAK